MPVDPKLMPQMEAKFRAERLGDAEKIAFKILKAEPGHRAALRIAATCLVRRGAHAKKLPPVFLKPIDVGTDAALVGALLPLFIDPDTAPPKAAGLAAAARIIDGFFAQGGTLPANEPSVWGAVVAAQGYLNRPERVAGRAPGRAALSRPRRRPGVRGRLCVE